MKLNQPKIYNKDEFNFRIKKLDLEIEKLGYKILKNFLSKNQILSANRIKSCIDLWKVIRKNGSADRLNPEGGLDSIMFIGINPSHRSKLTRVWDDPFGKFFKKLLIEAKIHPKKVWMTNLYKKITEDNRKLNDEEVEKGIEELIHEIGFVNPTVIVLLGEFVSEKVNNKIIHPNIIKINHPTYLVRKNTKEERLRYISQLKELKKYESS